MTAKRFTIPVTITLAVALALGVTSCSTDSEAVDPTPTALASPPVVTEPTEAPAPELPTAYIGGEQVPVDPALPLQENVIEAVRAVTSANTAAIVATNPPANGESVEAGVADATATSQARSLSASLSEATGRTVFVIAQGWGSADGDTYEMLWAVYHEAGLPSTKVRASASKDAVINGINAWIAAQADPSAYEVVVS